MSVLKLVREVYSSQTTIGKLMIEDVWFCHTLEDTVRAYGIKVKKHTAIPAAANKYKVKVTMSTKFERELPIIFTESNGYEIKHAGIRFAGVRFHRLNHHIQTWGCPGVGFQTNNIDTIWEAEEAEIALVAKLKELIACVPEDYLTLTIQNLRYDG